MASTTLPPQAPAVTHPLSPMAGVLSYLVPGLGQVVQGRVAKGLLFFVCINTLFFYGMWIGSGKVTVDGRPYEVLGNVYLPDTVEERDRDRGLSSLGHNLYNRPQFAGQFWVGIAAWPAVLQYRDYDRARAQEAEFELDRLYKDLNEHKNDPEKAAQIRQNIAVVESSRALNHPVFGSFMREPSGAAINALTNAGDKRLELAWVFTVIAGVLNIMVIYDAVAGPAFAGKEDPAHPQ